MADTQAIIEDIRAGMKYKDIAAKHGISQAYVSKLSARAKQPVDLDKDLAELRADEAAEDPAPAEEIIPGLTDDEINARVWEFSEQDRDQIHYSVVEMGNTPSSVSGYFNVPPEVIVRVVQIVSQRKEG